MPSSLLTNPWFYAVVSAVALTLGSAIGIWIKPKDSWQAILLAIGGGALIVSMSYELYDPAVKQLGKYLASAVFLGGVFTFGTLDILIEKITSDESKKEGWGLWASVTTDGIPENLAMGSLLTGQVHGALAFLFSLIITNGSQSMMSGDNMSKNRGKWKTLAAWTITGIVVGACVMIGYWYISTLSSSWVAGIRAFAGGAILASLAGEIYPDAFKDAGPWITIATAIGFLLTFVL